MPKPLDKVKIHTTDTVYQGILMPNESEESIFLKLDSGYNIGITKSAIKRTELIEAKKQAQITPKKEKLNPQKKTIAILHTGGTIASKVNYELGGVIAGFSAEDMLSMFPELKDIANIHTELISNMMSEDMTPDDYKKILKAIKKHSDKEGIIIGHGTDTLGYTAAALSFALEGIGIPVIIVGSQRSTDRGSTDGAQNLICAAEFITKTDFAGVAVCMHTSSEDSSCSILPGTNTRKMHTSRRDAFKSINKKPIAEIDLKNKSIKFLTQDYQKKHNNPIVIKDKFETDTALVKIHPFMKSSYFEFFTKNFKGIVLEATGLGHAPTNLGKNNLKIYSLLKEYIKKGGIVAITSQCLYGRVNPYVYTNLRRLSDIGCIYCEDMIPETALLKLSWLLGNYPKEKVKELLPTNIRGEISKRTLYEKDFIE